MDKETMWQLTFDAKWIIMFVENMTKLRFGQSCALQMDFSGWC